MNYKELILTDKDAYAILRAIRIRTGLEIDHLTELYKLRILIEDEKGDIELGYPICEQCGKEKTYQYTEINRHICKDCKI